MGHVQSTMYKLLTRSKEVQSLVEDFLSSLVQQQLIFFFFITFDVEGLFTPERGAGKPSSVQVSRTALKHALQLCSASCVNVTLKQ